MTDRTTDRCARACEAEEAAFYGGVEADVRGYSARALAGGRGERGLGMLVDDLHAYVDQQTAAVLSGAPPPLPLACRAGCSWCCRLVVEVTAPEVIRIAAYLREALPEAAFNALRARVAALDGRTRGMDRDARAEAGLPCALLENDLCSVYPVRPLKCRGGNSTDADRCRDFCETAEDGVLPIYAPQAFVADCVQAGLAGACAGAGLEMERLELTAALRIALEDPGAAGRWLAGEPVFAPARLVTESRMAPMADAGVERSGR